LGVVALEKTQSLFPEKVRSDEVETLDKVGYGATLHFLSISIFETCLKPVILRREATKNLPINTLADPSPSSG
jgi:hypothetical protein